MPKVVSSNQAKQQWGALMGYVSERGGEVIVESHGKPKVVLLSIPAYAQVLALRERHQRATALERLRRLGARVANHRHDVSEEEAEAIAEELSQEAIRRMTARGELRFARDQP